MRSRNQTALTTDILSQYDSIAEQYASHIDEQKLNALYERPYILSQLPPLSNKTFFDAGSGPGYFSIYAHSQGANVIAVDSSRELLKLLQERTGQSIETHVADLSKELNFIADQTVDVIVCSLVLHYIENWSTTLREFHRILKINGTCIISVHHPLFDARFNREEYFEKRLIQDSWLGFGKQPLNIQYYVRPLNEYLNPILALPWKSTLVDEPKPSERIKATEPGMFKALSKSPVFLFFKLVK